MMKPKKYEQQLQEKKLSREIKAVLIGVSNYYIEGESDLPFWKWEVIIENYEELILDSLDFYLEVLFIKIDTN